MCYVLLGATPAASKANLISWINGIVTLHGGQKALVKHMNGTIRPGLYQSLTLAEFLRIEAEISNCYIWIQQAINANLSAGRYYEIGGSGRGGGGGGLRYNP